MFGSTKIKCNHINTGVLGTTDLFPISFEANAIAYASGSTLTKLRNDENRGKAIEKMGLGASLLITELMAEQKIDGVIGMGGGGGTYMFISAIQNVPFGIPKLCLSTLATKDLSSQIGSKDVTLMPSIVDVVGINTISSVLINQASGALVGMMSIEKNVWSEKTKLVLL